MRISDWSSDVCSSDLSDGLHIATLLSALFLKHFPALVAAGNIFVAMPPLFRVDVGKQVFYALDEEEKRLLLEKIEREKGDRKKGMSGAVNVTRFKGLGEMNPSQLRERSEEHTSELQSLMRTSYAVFCLKKKHDTHPRRTTHIQATI